MEKDELSKKVEEATFSDLVMELKKQIKIIIVSILICLGTAVCYNFYIAKPVYQYSTLLQFPYNFTNSLLMNTYIKVLKDDIGITDAKLVAGTNIIELKFTANDSMAVKDEGDKLTLKSLEKLDTFIDEINERSILDKRIIDIKNKISFLSEVCISKDVNCVMVQKELQLLSNELTRYDNSLRSFRVKQVGAGKGTVQLIAPRKVHNILLAGIAGAILSVGFVMMKFLWRIVK